MTSRTSGAAALTAAGAATLGAGTVYGPVRRIRPAAKATHTAKPADFVARPAVVAPSAGRFQQAAVRLFESLGDRIGMPGRDAMVLVSVLAIVGAFFATALAVTAEPTASFDRQLEVQHAEWLAEQVAAGPVATMAP